MKYFLKEIFSEEKSSWKILSRNKSYWERNYFPERKIFPDEKSPEERSYFLNRKIFSREKLCIFLKEKSSWKKNFLEIKVFLEEKSSRKKNLLEREIFFEETFLKDIFSKGND